MSGLFRPLLLAAGCLASLCVMTAAQDTTLAPNTTAPSVLPNTTTTTTAPVPPPTLPTVTTPEPGGRRPNGLSALAPSPALSLPVVRAGPGRAAVRQHGGPSESGRGRAEVAAVGNRPGGKGRLSLGAVGLFPAQQCSARLEVLFKSAS